MRFSFGKITAAVVAATLLSVAGSQKLGADDFIRNKGPRNAFLVVLDVSSSMEGEPLQAVLNTLRKTADSLPADVGAGLISFSGCTPADVVLEVPVRERAMPDVISKAESITISDGTDILGAVIMALSEAERLGPQWCLKVLLLSDGRDSCGASRSEIKNIVGRIADASPCTQLDTITIGVPNWDTQFFDELSEVGNGESHHAEDLTKIEEKLNEALEEFMTNKDKAKWDGDFSTDPTKPSDPKKPGDPDDDKKDGPKGPDPDPLDAGMKKKKKKPANPVPTPNPPRSGNGANL